MRRSSALIYLSGKIYLYNAISYHSITLHLHPCFFLFASIGECTSLPNAPIDDEAYQDIDKLVAMGLIQNAVCGLAWSRNEIARMIDEARKHLETENSASVRQNKYLAASVLLGRLEQQFQDELAGTGGERIREFFFFRASGWPQESMDNREGADIRVQIPQLRNVVIYAEGVSRILEEIPSCRS